MIFTFATRLLPVLTYHIAVMRELARGALSNLSFVWLLLSGEVLTVHEATCEVLHDVIVLNLLLIDRRRRLSLSLREDMLWITFVVVARALATDCVHLLRCFS